MKRSTKRSKRNVFVSFLFIGCVEIPYISKTQKWVGCPLNNVYCHCHSKKYSATREGTSQLSLFNGNPFKISLNSFVQSFINSKVLEKCELWFYHIFDICLRIYNLFILFEIKWKDCHYTHIVCIRWKFQIDLIIIKGDMGPFICAHKCSLMIQISLPHL